MTGTGGSLRDELFRLLPAVYQRRDAEPASGHALQAVVEVLGEQADVVAADLALLYDDWFIETCADWVVPYLGDLLGTGLLHPVGPGAGRPRAFVANTLDYRRRKGTLAVLEQLAYDVTGWPAVGVEYFQRLGVTQHLAHPRPANVRTPDLRRAAELELTAGPFSRTAHTAEVRRLPAGRFGIGNVGLHVWRLVPRTVLRATARPVTDPPDGRYHIDPVGLGVPLFNPGTTEARITSLAQEQHAPGPLRRRALFDELEGLRAGTVTDPLWFGADPVVEVFADLGAGMVAVPATALTAADLSDQPVPPATGWPRPDASLTVAVDPVLGRLAFAPALVPVAVEVTATCAAPGRVGAGPDDHTSPQVTDLLERAAWFRAVGGRAAPVPDRVVDTLAAAVADWALQPAGTVGVIAVVDSRTYREDLNVLVPAGSELLLVAATWPQAENADAATVLTLEQVTAADRRPHLLGSIEVSGAASGDAQLLPGELTVDGFLVEGDLTVAAGDLGRLTLSHSTVVPGIGTLSVQAPTSPATDNGRLVVDLVGSITGSVSLAAEGPDLEALASIVDGPLNAPSARLSLDRVTVLGDLTGRELNASDCLLVGAVSVTRRQQGCLRFSYVAPQAVAPRRYRCQPDVALDVVHAQHPGDEGRAAAARTRLTPVFSSTTYGDPAYGRLDDRSDPALLTGASNGAALGAYADQQEPQRMANLTAVLEEYLRLGLEAGVIHES